MLGTIVTLIGAFSEILRRYRYYDACKAIAVLYHSMIAYYDSYLQLSAYASSQSGMTVVTNRRRRRQKYSTVVRYGLVDIAVSTKNIHNYIPRQQQKLMNIVII